MTQEMFTQGGVRNVEVGISCETTTKVQTNLGTTAVRSCTINQSAYVFRISPASRRTRIETFPLCMCGLATAVIVESLWQLVVWFLFALFFHCFVNQYNRKHD